MSKMVVRSCEMELPSLNAYGSKDLLERERTNERKSVKVCDNRPFSSSQKLKISAPKCFDPKSEMFYLLQ